MKEGFVQEAPVEPFTSEDTGVNDGNFNTESGSESEPEPENGDVFWNLRQTGLAERNTQYIY